ncbi:MAG: hypothetical protein Q7T03_09535 [Deltaproteobacteria bacterium]|nr:hypothetical protein [Deltaproteobacteria bacterium]
MTGTGGSVSLTGSVEEPSTVSASVSVGASASKSVNSGSSDEGASGFSVSKASSSEQDAPKPLLIVSKATVELPASGGSCTAKTPGGTSLDTGSISATGAFSGLSIDPTALDTTKQVLIDCTTANNKRFTTMCDATTTDGVTSINCGTMNSDSTLSVQQIYFQGDANCTPADPSACAAQFASGAIKPLALFQTFQKTYDVSSTAGSDTAASAMQSMRKAWRAAMANGTPSFGDINSALGGGGIINTWKAFDPDLSAIDMSAAMTQIQSYMPACAKTFADSTTFTKYSSAGSAGWGAAAQYFSKQTSTELANGIARPEIFQGVMNQYATDYSNGNTAAFNTMSNGGAARMMGQMAGKCSVSDLSGKYDEMQKMVDAQASSFGALTSAQMASMGEAFCNTLKGADSAAKLLLINNDPGSYAGRMFANPDAYTGASGGDTVGNIFTLGQQGFTLTNMVPCQTSDQCPSGQSCGGFNNCVSSVTCSSSCGFGSLCASNGACTTGCCGSGCSGNGSCIFPAGVSGGGAVLKGLGVACTANSECYSSNCLNSTCSYYGDASLLANGVACTTNGQCSSGNCESSLCAAVVGYPRTLIWTTKVTGTTPDPCDGGTVKFKLIQSSATAGIMYQHNGADDFNGGDSATESVITSSTASGGNITVGSGGAAGIGTFATAQLNLNYSDICLRRYTP